MDNVTALMAAGADADLPAQVRAQVRAEPLTILRLAAAIAHAQGVVPVDAVTDACAAEVATLTSVPPPEVRRAMEEVLLGRDVDVALQWLHQVGVLAIYIPELEACVDLVQETGRQHKDVWDHTKQVVRQSVRRPAVRWAALLHDIGKVPTRTFTRNGVHFHGHAEVGARMFDKVVQRLPFEREQRQKIRFLIKHHLRSNQYSETWTDSAVRRFHREMEAHLTDLLDLSRADITSKRPGKRRSLLAQISALAQRIERLAAEDAVLPPLPTGIGNAIMEAFALPPSRRIGELKRLVEERVALGELEARREEAYYVAWLRASGAIDGIVPPVPAPAADATAASDATDCSDATAASDATDCACGDDGDDDDDDAQDDDARDPQR